MSLKGSLQTVALPEVLQFLSSTGKSGEFHVSGSRGEGRLWFDAGRVSALDVRLAEVPAEAIFELLRISDGEFSFAAGVDRPEDARPVDEADGDIGPALEAAEIRLAEWDQIVAVVPSLGHRVELRDAPGDEVQLSAEQWAMVVSIAGGRSVGEVIDERSLQEFDGCRTIRSLVEASLVEVVEPPVTDEPVAEEPAVEESAAEESAPEEAAAFAEPAAFDGPHPFVEPAAEEPAASAEPFAFAEAVALAEPVATEEPVAFAEPAVEEAFTEGADAEGATAEPLHFGAFGAFAPAAEEVTEAHATSWDNGDVESDADLMRKGFGGLEPVHSELGDEALTGDHYAALRAAMVEVGENLTDESEPTYEAPAHVYEVSPEGDGRAALQALLSEVAAPAEDAVDGLADRGPWTAHELSSMDTAGGWAEDDPEHSNIVPFAPVHHAEVEGGYEAEAEDAAFDTAEAPEEEPPPAEEPVNRGLLLKFLSSVRN